MLARVISTKMTNVSHFEKKEKGAGSELTVEVAANIEKTFVDVE